jgi:hypothetical protein
LSDVNSVEYEALKNKIYSKVSNRYMLYLIEGITKCPKVQQESTSKCKIN